MIPVLKIKSILKEYEASRCSSFFFKNENCPDIEALKKLLANMTPDSRLNGQQLFEFAMLVLEPKVRAVDTKSIIYIKYLLPELEKLFSTRQSYAITSLPNHKLFKNPENVAAIMRTKNPTLFSVVLSGLYSYAHVYREFIGVDYPTLGEKINEIRAIANSNGENSRQQYERITSSLKEELRKKIVTQEKTPEIRAESPVASFRPS